MLEQLKRLVYEQNMKLKEYGLVVLTWGNVSAIDRESGLVVIKPSGVPYETMKPDDMSVVDLSSGKLIEGKSPSSDTPTHLRLYREFDGIGGVVHTHSINAVAWAQAGKAIPSYGTTHADAFYGAVPCTRALTEKEVENDYEANTGSVIADLFKNLDYNAVPAVLVKNHGPFTWGATCEKAVENALTLEVVAEMALKTAKIESNTPEIPKYLIDKHYFRKHGKNSYYGQKTR